MDGIIEIKAAELQSAARRLSAGGRHPLGGMFGYNYLITGTWDDPKVEKLSANVPAETTPRQPGTPNSRGAANEPSQR